MLHYIPALFILAAGQDFLEHIALERSQFPGLKEREAGWDMGVSPFDDSATAVIFPAGVSRTRLFFIEYGSVPLSGYLSCMTWLENGIVRKDWSIKLGPSRKAKIAKGTLFRYLQRKGLAPLFQPVASVRHVLAAQPPHSVFNFDVLGDFASSRAIRSDGTWGAAHRQVGIILQDDAPRTNRPYPIPFEEIAYLAFHPH